MPYIDQKELKLLSDDEVFVMSLQNPDLFGEIMNRYQTAFIRKAREILSDENDVYDAVQEAFVRIYSAARNYRKQESASFKSWGYKILMNQCFTMYQKKKKEWQRTAHVDDEFIECIPDQREIDAYDQKLTKEHLLSLISRLPLILAKTVTLFFLDDFSQKEIAKIEGVSHEVVRGRIHKAKTELKKLGVNLYSKI